MSPSLTGGILLVSARRRKRRQPLHPQPKCGASVCSPFESLFFLFLFFLATTPWLSPFDSAAIDWRCTEKKHSVCRSESCIREPTTYSWMKSIMSPSVRNMYISMTVFQCGHVISCAHSGLERLMSLCSDSC